MNGDDAISYVLMMVKSPSGAPSLEAAAKMLGVGVADLDTVFGVVTINPDHQLYSVRVDSRKLPEGGDPENGPYSDPSIEPMGPPS